MKAKSKAAGFTLIEVLIAATILFTVVAAVSQVYQGATKASLSASRSVEVSALVPLLADTISFHLRQADVTQQVTQQGILNDYRFSWTASVIRRGAPPAKFEFETDSYTTFDEKFYLWQVELEIEKDNYAQQYQFTTLSWKGL